jgi:protein TonB
MLLLLALLTLGRERATPPRAEETLTVLELAEPEPEAAPAEPRRAERKAEQADAPRPQPPERQVRKPDIKPAVSIPLIQVSPEEMAVSDIAKLPAPPARAKSRMGPPTTGTPGDSERVPGAGPNGEPLYAARWYREPYDNELSGYLSTAQGPGWGLIACKTVADFRVEDCVGLDEYPEGSSIMRAVLAAAGQFRVRPPRLGGQSQVGEWVRIRIVYTSKRN